MDIRSWGWVLLGCAVSMSALAQEGDFISKTNKSYVLLSAGRSNTPMACNASERWLVDSTCNSKGTIYRVGYGYNITSFWAMELSYGDFAYAREDGWDPAPPLVVTGGVPPPSPVRYYRTWSAIGWEIATVGTLHLGEHLSLHAKAGWLRAHVEEEVWFYPTSGTTAGELWHGNYKASNNTASVSGGAQFDFNRDVGLRLQVNRYNKLPGTHQLDATTNKFKTTSVLASLVLKF